MQAVILAAGMGTRLRPMTETLPKALIPVGKKPLLYYSLDNLNKLKIKDVIIVTGYHEKLIKNILSNQYQDIKITYIRNDRYSETGSMYSFSQTRELLHEDVILLESDLLYDIKALDILIHSSYRDAILVSELLHSGDDVYVCANDENEIIYLGKQLDENYKTQVKGALVGISKYSQEFLQQLFDRADADYQNNEWYYHYEECVLQTSKTSDPVYAVLCADLNWIEIDNENDYLRAKTEIYPKIKGEKNEGN